MLLKPYNTICIDLANTPLIEFYANDAPEPDTGKQLYKLKFGSGTTHTFYCKEGLDVIKQGVAEYNKSGKGNYYWLFSNVCINLDIVGSVNRRGNQMNVTYAVG